MQVSSEKEDTSDSRKGNKEHIIQSKRCDLSCSGPHWNISDSEIKKGTQEQVTLIEIGICAKHRPETPE
jgi:hypothetical protein